jgi:hypothetical protein
MIKSLRMLKQALGDLLHALALHPDVGLVEKIVLRKLKAGMLLSDSRSHV